MSFGTLNNKTIDVTKLNQGTDFVAVVTVYNPGMMDYRDLALTQIFPFRGGKFRTTGFLILNSRKVLLIQLIRISGMTGSILILT